jgi:hypothetical protein
VGSAEWSAELIRKGRAGSRFLYEQRLHLRPNDRTRGQQERVSRGAQQGSKGAKMRVFAGNARAVSLSLSMSMSLSVLVSVSGS